MELIVADSTVVTVKGESLTGPLRLTVESATVGSVSYVRGVVFVKDGIGLETSRFTAEEGAVLPFVVIIPFILALIWAQRV